MYLICLILLILSETIETFIVTFEVRENAVGVGQTDSTAKFGIGETVGNSEVVEDDYGIAVIPDMFVDIVTGVDPSKFAGSSGRIGEEVIRRGFGFGTVDTGGKNLAKERSSLVSQFCSFFLVFTFTNFNP